MRKLVWVVVLVALVLGGRHYWRASEQRYAEKGARDRVEAVLRAFAAGDEQSAICQWAAGKPILPSEEIAAHTDAFADFARATRLSRGMRWSVAEVRAQPPQAAQVVVRIDDSPKTWIVRSGERIETSR